LPEELHWRQSWRTYQLKYKLMTRK
jgi:hypothetical protein